MISLCFNQAATVVSPFCFNLFYFLAKLSKICEIFSSCEKRTMKLSLLHKNVNTSSHIKGNLMFNQRLTKRVPQDSPRLASVASDCEKKLCAENKH